MQVFFSLSLIVLLAACTPGAQVQKSWSDPSLTPETVKPFKKILVVASLKDEASRRVAEDKIATLGEPGQSHQARFIGTLPSVRSIKANPLRGGDAKPWVYHPAPAGS